jgi:transposase
MAVHVMEYSMGKSYRPWNPTQPYLLPPSPSEWLPEDHLAYFVLETVGELDLNSIESRLQEREPRGERPYDPQMMVSLLLYAYSVGVYSSRKIARGTREDVAMRVISGGGSPHFTTVNGFRLEHRQALAGLFVQVFRLCRKAGLVRLGHVSFDGSKVAANASKHRAMSYARMQEEEKKIEEEVEKLLRRAEEVDREEDNRWGSGDGAEDLPQELKRRHQRLARIREAKAELEREAAESRAAQLREQAEGQQQKAEDENEDPAERRRSGTRAEKSRRQAQELDPQPQDSSQRQPSGEEPSLPMHRVSTTPEGKPAARAQRNFTDPDSRIMKRDGGYLQGYNAQIAVDGDYQVIVAQALTNQAADQSHLIAMIEGVKTICGELPEVGTADAGYFTPENARYCEDQGFEALIAVGREHGRGEGVSAGTQADESAARMRAKLDSEEGRALYRRRKAIVEPTFGQIREARGFRRFLLRGLSKVRDEWALVCTAHNMVKLHRYRREALALQ